MSYRVSLPYQDLLEMLHLEGMEHTLSIRPAAWGFLFIINYSTLNVQLVCGFREPSTCLHAAHIWSINFSRLVHRAARNAAVLPGVGSSALPGAPEVDEFTS